MAKVHKAHKSNKKYGFQKKKLSVKTLLIVLAVVIVAAIGLKVAYDNYVYGEFEITAPSNETLNNIAANWEMLNADTEHFYNYYDAYYAMMGYDTTTLDGTDGNGGVHLYYTGNENIDEVYLYINAGEQSTETETTALGAFGRTTLTNFINGVAPWGQTAVQLQAANANCTVSVYDADVENIDGTLLTEVLAEIEAIIAAGPVVTEDAAETTEAPVEETTEAPAEESAEAAE